jgi:hypothetical protein
MRRRLLAGALVVGLLLAGCGGAPARPTTGPDAAPLPAGPVPSALAKMPCQPEAQHDIAEALGVRSVVTDTTWANHKYSCRYRYPTGTMQLSIKELSSWGQTLAYFHGLGHVLGNTEPLGNLGQGAFRTTDGSVVVRKDWKVLLVDVSRLPSPFGRPPTPSADVAYTVAAVILQCWAGD